LRTEGLAALSDISRQYISSLRLSSAWLGAVPVARTRTRPDFPIETCVALLFGAIPELGATPDKGSQMFVEYRDAQAVENAGRMTNRSRVLGANVSIELRRHSKESRYFQ
jgi:hypothetical protein